MKGRASSCPGVSGLRSLLAPGFPGGRSQAGALPAEARLLAGEQGSPADTFPVPAPPRWEDWRLSSPPARRQERSLLSPATSSLTLSSPLPWLWLELSLASVPCCPGADPACGGHFFPGSHCPVETRVATGWPASHLLGLQVTLLPTLSPALARHPGGSSSCVGCNNSYQ